MGKLLFAIMNLEINGYFGHYQNFHNLGRKRNSFGENKFWINIVKFFKVWVQNSNFLWWDRNCKDFCGFMCNRVQKFMCRRYYWDKVEQEAFLLFTWSFGLLRGKLNKRHVFMTKSTAGQQIQLVKKGSAGIANDQQNSLMNDCIRIRKNRIKCHHNYQGQFRNFGPWMYFCWFEYWQLFKEFKTGLLRVCFISWLVSFFDCVLLTVFYFLVGIFFFFVSVFVLSQLNET